MEDGDDEFGDLYADVEVEATSAMNVAHQFHQLSTETDKQKSELEVISDKVDRASDGIDLDDDEDDDDDDLDIVLNSDDDSVKHGEGFMIGRAAANTKLRSGELEDEDDDNLVMEEFVVGKAGGSSGDGVNQKGVYNSHSMYKYLRSNSTTYASDSKGSGCGVGEDNGYCQRMGSRSMGPGPQSGQRFSLPRARNILDVNIDIFEQKPWKHPGADITDYFNFGFNEDAWKLYCNQVDEYRHRSSGTPALEPAQLMETKAYGGGIEHEIVDGDACENSETRQVRVPSSMLRISFREQQPKRRKGQAIQVEDSNFERQSSMDVRRQLDRDSDAIQITILDPEENCSGSTKEGLSYLDGSVPEAPNHGDTTGDDGKDHLSFSSASEDESIEGNHLEMEIYALKRSSNRRSSSKPEKTGSENHGIHQISDVYGPQCSRMNVSGSGGTDETIRTSDSSKAKKIPANHCIPFESGVDKPKSYGHERLAVRPGYHHSDDSKRLDDKWEHEDSKCKYHDENDDSHPRRLNTKRKPGDRKYHARCNSPVYNNRIHMVSKLKLHPENHDFCSRKPVYNHRGCGLSDLKAHHEIDDSFPMSDIGGTYDVRSMVGHNKRNERLHSLDPYDEGNVSYSRELELPSRYYGERFYGYGDRDILARDIHHEGYERFEASAFRSSEEEEYYGEERRYIEDDKMMARDWCHNEREVAVEFFSSENSEYPSYLKYKRGAQWKRKGDNLHFRNKDEYDECFLEQEYSDDIQGEKFRSLAYYDRERDDFEHNYVKHVEYTRWEFRGPGRNKSGPGVPSSELNRPLLKRDGDRYPRYKKGHSYTSRSSEECHTSDAMTPRNSLHRRHGRYTAQWIERYRYDGSLDDPEPFVDGENYTMDINDCVDMGRTRRNRQSEMQWRKEDEVILRNDDAESCGERASFRFGKVSRRKNLVSEHEFDQIEESIDHPRIEGCIYKPREGDIHDKFRGSGDSLCSQLVNDSNNVEEVLNELNAEGCKYEGRREVISGNKCSKTQGKSLEQPSLSCRNSLDSDSLLVVGEGKSADKAETNVAEWIKPARMDFDSCPSDKPAVKAREGQIPTKELKITKNDSGPHVNDVKGQNGKMGFDNSRILEAMAKMEKRRARFKEQITTTKSDSDSTNKPTVVDSVQQRPARKRRWGGS